MKFHFYNKLLKNNTFYWSKICHGLEKNYIYTSQTEKSLMHKIYERHVKQKQNAHVREQSRIRNTPV